MLSRIEQRKEETSAKGRDKGDMQQYEAYVQLEGGTSLCCMVSLILYIWSHVFTAVLKGI